MKFNINHKVKVKLTAKGLQILRKDHADLKAIFPSAGEFQEPKTDENGFSEFQLWEIMNTFGPHFHNGCQVPFETEIEIPQNVTDETRGTET